MTNAEIIFDEAINNGIFTEEEAIKCIEQFGSLPIHTYAGWKAQGYSVKRGEHAKITTKLWKYVKAKKKAEKEAEEKEDKWYLCKAFLFTSDQVEKVG